MEYKETTKLKFKTFYRLITSSYGDDFKLIKHDHSPGIYYDFVQDLLFYENSWKLVTYLDLSHIDDKLHLITSNFEKTKLYCNENSVYKELLLCNTSIQILEHLIPEMKMKERNLKDLIGHNRVKRGWINALGSLFKTITGNLDNSDAEYYNDAINKINDSEYELTQLIKAQVQVVQTTITNFNETITNLHKNEKIFNENIKAIESYTKLFETRVYNLEVKENIKQHLNFLTLR